MTFFDFESLKRPNDRRIGGGNRQDGTSVSMTLSRAYRRRSHQKTKSIKNWTEFGSGFEWTAIGFKISPDRVIDDRPSVLAEEASIIYP